MGDLSDLVYQITTWILPALVAITLHEAAHGWVASQLGDDTARRLGRVTFNPLKHVDPFGTVVLPAMLLLASGGRMMFGFAKPVPVNFARLRHPRRDMVLVAVAGPGINIAMALVAAALLVQLPAERGDALLTIPLARPLASLEPYGFFIILGLVFILPLLGRQIGLDLGVMDWLVIAPAEWITRLILGLVAPG